MTTVLKDSEMRTLPSYLSTSRVHVPGQSDYPVYSNIRDSIFNDRKPF